VSPDGASVYVTSPEGIAHFFRVQAGSSGTGGNGGGKGGAGGANGGGGAGGNGAGGATTPALTSFTIAPHAFTALAGGASVIVQQSSRRGGKVTFQLNVAASVRYVIKHNVPGRTQRVNGAIRCEAQTHKNAHASRCVRVVTVGSSMQPGTAGANSFRFSGRLDGQRLQVGSYTLVASPTAGKSGPAVTTNLRIKHA
jgi:hypothetical protein